MMSINKENYEAWFLDYSEGTLSPQQVAELLRFVDAHPELREELEMFEPVTLPEETITFQPKESLKKAEALLPDHWITPDNCEERFIEAAEGLLSLPEQAAIEAFLLANPAQKSTYLAYQNTRLKAGTNIFEGKDALRKSEADALTAIDMLLIGASEGTLTPAEENELRTLLAKQPALQEEQKVYAAARLEAPLMFFPDKASLRKKERKGLVVPLWSYGAAAAAIALFVFWKFSGTDEGSSPILAAQTDTVENVIPVTPEQSAPQLQNEAALAVNANNALEENASPKDVQELPSPQQNSSNNNSTIAQQEAVQEQPTPQQQTPTEHPEVHVALENNDDVKETPEEAPLQPIELMSPNEDDAVVAVNQTEEIPTPMELVKKKVKTGLTGQEKQANDRITANEVASNLAARVDDVTSTKVAYNTDHNDTRKKWSLQIGKFGISQSKSAH